MKKLNTLIILILFSQILIGQEFSFKMYFEDSVGNKDTLLIGFDFNGTDTIDTEFGEINIISVPLNTSLDVRISNEWQNRLYQNIPGTFHTKKQIIEKKECGYWFSINNIDIFTDNWPVIAHWDSTLFKVTCLNGSLFTSVMPGGWWDTGGFREILHNSSSISFSQNYQYFDDYYGYINENNDTIDVFWQTFGDSTILMVGVEENKKHVMKLFPNPTSNKITVELINQDQRVNCIRVLDMNGRIWPIKQIGNELDFSDELDGMYFVQLILESGQVITKMTSPK